MKGLFVVFEGIAGSGKDVQIKMLTERLKNEKKEVTNIAFPNFESDIARLTKRLNLDPYTLSLIYAADRAQHQERIKGLLEKGNIVICDRYCYSNFAYQSVRGIPLDWLMLIERNIIRPHIVFFIDISVDTSIRRIQQANIEDFTKGEILERLRREKENLEKIRTIYQHLARTDLQSKWHIVDGTQDIMKNHELIFNTVKTELQLLS